MITVRETTWTDPNETLDFAEKFGERYGENVAIPMCQRCTRATCYIVEKTEGARPEKKGVAFLTNIIKLAVIQYDDKLFFPTSICEDCLAKDDARVRFNSGFNTPSPLAARDMTEADKARYRRVFAEKIEELKRAQIEQFEKKATKYSLGHR